jgi:hypothetical protein
MILFALATAPATAHAQDDDIRDGRGFYYAYTGLEASVLVGGLALYGGYELGEAIGSGGGEPMALLLAAVPLGGGLPASIAIGLTADENNWDPLPALAIHGGMWSFWLGGLLGALLDGSDDTQGSALAFGPWTVVFAVAGAALSALTAFTQLERGIEGTVWYLGPIVGLITGWITGLATEDWQDAGANETVQSRRKWSATLLGFGIPFAAAHVLPFVVRD